MLLELRGKTLSHPPRQLEDLDKTKKQRLKGKFMSTFYAKWGAEKKRYLTSGNQCFYSNITPASLILGKV